MNSVIILCIICLIKLRSCLAVDNRTLEILALPKTLLGLLQNQVDLEDLLFYNRYFQTEGEICDLYNHTVSRLSDRFVREMNDAVAFTKRQMSLVRQFDQDADLCVTSLQTELAKRINQETDTFRKCTGSALPSQLNRQLVNLKKNKKKYLKTKRITLNNVKQCYKQYSSKIARSKRDQCIEANRGKLKAVAEVAMEMDRDSPCMDSFHRFGVRLCLEESYTTINGEAMALLDRLRSCSDDLDPEPLERMSKPNFTGQIQYCQQKYNTLKQELEEKIRYYNELEFKAMSNVDFTQFDIEYFEKQLYDNLKFYFDEMQIINEDNPNEAELCGKKTVFELNGMVKKFGNEYLTCNREKTREAREYMGDIRIQLALLSNNISQHGNIAILKCFEEGIFQEDTIIDCYELDFRLFKIYSDNILQKIKYTAEKLMNYNFPKNQLPGSAMPCGEVMADQIEVLADTILQRYEKCVFKNTGEKIQKISLQRYKNATLT